MSDSGHDRSTELYEGRIGSVADQRLLAARVHWMISHVEGRDVLDVGCGQGIASLLLARDGRRAVGVDNELAVVEWASARARTEQASVQRLLSYEVADAAELPFAERTYDAVLLGAVLEYQIDPSLIIGEALRVLRPGGRLVITSLYAELRAPPFGEPLYLQGLIGLLSGKVEVDDIALLDRYAAIAGTAVEGAAKPLLAIWLQALSVAERGLARLQKPSIASGRRAASGPEQELQDELADHATRVERLEDELERIRAAHTDAALSDQRRAEAEAHAAELAKLGITIGQATQRLVVLEAEKSALARQVAESHAETSRLEESLSGEQEALRAARTQAVESAGQEQQARAESTELTAAAERLKARIASQTDRIAALEKAVAAADRDAGRFDQRWRHATDHADKLERALKDARAELARTQAGHDAPDREATVGPTEVPRPRAEGPAQPRGRRRSHQRAEPSYRVLHLMARSLPCAPSPITLDRHGLLIAQRQSGLDSSGVTDLDFPSAQLRADPRACEFVDGVAYYRLHDLDPDDDADRLARATSIAEPLLEIVEPQILHAASVDVAPLTVALAERHALPCVVELASELAPGDELDLDVLSGARYVVALSDEQRAAVIAGGMPPKRVQVIPAFVDTSRFSSPELDPNGSGTPLIGAIAYRPDSPAVDVLREALSSAGRSARGLVVRPVASADDPHGDGDPPLELADGALAQLDSAASEIPRWLSRMDIVIAATPHEALDAMAASRPVIGVGAATVVSSGIEDLAPLLSSSERRAAHGTAARKVIEARHTTAAIEAYPRLYAVGVR